MYHVIIYVHSCWIKDQVSWKMQSCWCYTFPLEDFNGKNLKIFVKPLTCTSQLSKWNVSRDSSTNPVPIYKTLVKIIKFGDNPTTEVEPKNNCYD